MNADLFKNLSSSTVLMPYAFICVLFHDLCFYFAFEPDYGHLAYVPKRGATSLPTTDCFYLHLPLNYA